MADKGKGNKLIKEQVHDPYMAKGKPTEPTVCPQCKTVFSDGRWQWIDPVPEGSNEESCPACRRIKDNIPAGFLKLGGEFFKKHREEILALARNKEESEKAEHPLKRIMNIEDDGEDGVVITFTDMHLPRGVGEAVKSAYEGDLDIQFSDDIVRASWTR